MRSSPPSAELPPGKKWMGIDVGVPGLAQTQLGGSSDLNEQLTMLQAASGDVEDLGEATVFGESTTAYRATVDYRRYAAFFRREGDAEAARQIEKTAALAGSDPKLTVWIDADGIMRKMQVAMSIPSIEGRPALAVDMDAIFSELTYSPDVQLPEAGEVFDVTAMGRAEIGLLDGSTVRLPGPAPGAALPSTAAYRKRANAFCRRALQRGKRLARRTKPATEELRELRQARGARAAVEALPAFTREYIEPEVDWLDSTFSRFTRLPPPSSLADQVDRFDRISATQIETLYAYSEASQIKDVRLVQKMARQQKTLTLRANRIARRIGLGECGKEIGQDG
jgi:hypothetical protein